MTAMTAKSSSSPSFKANFIPRRISKAKAVQNMVTTLLMSSPCSSVHPSVASRKVTSLPGHKEMVK
jgi:hypothetical protein